MRPRPLAVAVLCGSALSTGQGAYAQEAPIPPDTLQPVLEGHALRVTSGASVTVVELGCEGRASLRTQNKVFVACGSDGVVEIDISNPLDPRRTGWMPVEGDATALFLRDGRVWVEIAHVDARPVLLGAVPTSAPTPMGPSPPIASPAAAALGPAAPAASPKPSLMAPPRRSGLWEISALAGALINLGPVAGGATGWASVVYRFDAPIVVRAELSPLSAPIGSSGNTVVAASHLLVGLDTQFIEVAVGGGGASIRNAFSSSGTLAPGGPSIVEEGRFGARDGLALNVESITVAANNQFQFGSFVASIQVPLTRRVMLVARGGGGNVGLLFGDLGARAIVQGDGGPDTIALTGFVGGAGIDVQTCVSTASPAFGGDSACQSTTIGGPSIGAGVEWRR